MRAPGVGHRGAKGCQRRSRMGQGMPIWPVKGAQAVPKWIQNGPGHGQSTSSENIKKPLVFPLQMAPEPVQNLPKCAPRAKWQASWQGRGPQCQVRWQVRSWPGPGAEFWPRVMWQVGCWPGSRAGASGRSGGRSGPVKGPGNPGTLKSLRYICNFY